MSEQRTVEQKMTQNERPGDWYAWMRHHKGEEDLLVGKRGGY
jgi:hypothetical protein